MNFLSLAGWSLHCLSVLVSSNPCHLVDWSVTPSSFIVPAIKVTWNISSIVGCSDRVYIWYRWEEQESQATPDSHLGEVTLPILDRCQVVTVSLGLLDSYSDLGTTRTVWLPSLITSVSTLSSLAVFSTSQECSMQDFHLTVCPMEKSEECRVIQPTSYTQTYISGMSPCTDYTFTLHQTSSSLALWSYESNTLVSIDIQLTMGVRTANMSTVYRRSCKVESTLWRVTFCRAEGGSTVDVQDDGDQDVGDQDDDSCRHITVHPDQLLTTAIIDGLSPCTQYIIRLRSDESIQSEEKILTDQTLCSES